MSSTKFISHFVEGFFTFSFPNPKFVYKEGIRDHQSWQRKAEFQSSKFFQYKLNFHIDEKIFRQIEKSATFTVA